MSVNLPCFGTGFITGHSFLFFSFFLFYFILFYRLLLVVVTCTKTLCALNPGNVCWLDTKEYSLKEISRLVICVCGLMLVMY